jgi:hypothetical protein
MDRHQPWLIYLWMPETVNKPPPPYKTLTFTGPDGAVYRPSANLELHVKRSDKAKVHTFLLTLGYEVRERNGRYTLKMNTNYWGDLKAVPDELPDIFPNRGESAYNELFYAYSRFWQTFVRPFVGVRHEDVHKDNSGET